MAEYWNKKIEVPAGKPYHVFLFKEVLGERP